LEIVGELRPGIDPDGNFDAPRRDRRSRKSGCREESRDYDRSYPTGGSFHALIPSLSRFLASLEDYIAVARLCQRKISRA
jgi:hypothetical protein